MVSDWARDHKFGTKSAHYQRLFIESLSSIKMPALAVQLRVIVPMVRYRGLAGVGFDLLNLSVKF